jgi:hypothetical protein
MMLNTRIYAKEQSETATKAETIIIEPGELEGCGFTSEEIIALLWLQNWYRTGGSDRVALVRHWTFLKLLVIDGKLDV